MTKPLSNQAQTSEESSMTDEMNKFLIKFEKTVKAQKQKTLIDFIDVDYKVKHQGIQISD